jgi:hypothetical protein
MTEEFFADLISGVGLMGSMVRIDFASFSATEKDAEGKPAMNFHHRVVMPPEGFLRSFAAMQNLIKQLEQAGVLKRVSPDDNSAAPAAALPAAAPKSPNFS